MSKEIRYFTQDANSIYLKSNKLLVDGRYRDSRIIEEAIRYAKPQHKAFQIRRNNKAKTPIINLAEAKKWLK